MRKATKKRTFGGKASPFKSGAKKVLKKGYRFAKGGRVVKAKK